MGAWFGQGAAAGGAGAIGVAHGERQPPADLAGCAQAGAGLVGQGKQLPAVGDRVEFGGIEIVAGAGGAEQGGASDGPVVQAVVAGVQVAGGVCAEQPDEGTGAGVGELADGGDPEPVQGFGGRGSEKNRTVPSPRSRVVPWD